MIFVLDWNIEETQYGVSPEMIDDAVVLHDYVGAAPEEFSDERSDFLRSTLMNQRGKSPHVREEHRDFGEVTRLPVDVLNVAQARVLFAPVHSQNAPDPTTEADEMGLTVDEQHDAPQDRLGIERILGETGSQRVPVVDHAAGGKLYFGSWVLTHQGPIYIGYG